jgi:hypothetical protein
MSYPDDADTDDNQDEPALTRDAVTPRGGFMARPGLKAPPRHAVVIRGGDVEPSEDIPVVRGSHPPPAPASEPPPASSDEKVTLRAIPTGMPEPTPKSELPTQLDLTPPRPVARPLESLPPPSDMPVVASVPAPDLVQTQAQARRRARPRWSIVAAAAAGLLLGLASIAATRAQRDGDSKAAAAPIVPAESLAPTSQALEPPGLEAELGRQPPLAPLPSASSDAPVPAAGASRQAPAASERARQAGSKRSIF